jgi:predicted O-methyltransferase YrrM
MPILTPEVGAYIDRLTGPTSSLAERLAAHAKQRGFPLIGETSGRWLELLTRAIGGKRVFEFGSGFGFSAHYFARAVGPGGEVVGSECDDHELEDFDRLFGTDPLRDRITIHHGSALDVFSNTTGTFDAVLIDIDKEQYIDALEAAIPRVRPGGLILADNVLWGGMTAQCNGPSDPATDVLKAFNERIASDPRLLTGILPSGDGLSVSLVQR